MIKQIKLLYKALNLLLYQSIKNTPQTYVKEIKIDKNSVRTYVFTPTNHLLKQKKLPIIVFIHGMSPMGIDDKRQTRLCQSLASLGYLVLAPEISSIKNCNPSPEIIDELGILFKAIYQKYQQNFSIFSASYSSTACMLTIAQREHLNQIISSVLSINCFSSLTRICKYWFESEDVDPYGTHIFLKRYFAALDQTHQNILQKKNKRYKELSIMFEKAILKNWYALQENNSSYNLEYDSFLNKLSKQNKELFLSLCSSSHKRLEYYENIMNYFRTYKDSLELEKMANAIKIPIFLLHGKHDKLMPSQESVYLSHEFKKNSIQYLLLISPLIEHSNDQISFYKYPIDIIKLLLFFTRFFHTTLS